MLAIKTAVILSLVAAAAHAATIYGSCDPYDVTRGSNVENYWGTCYAPDGSGGQDARKCKKANACSTQDHDCSFDPLSQGADPNNDAVCN
ncbi:unnamed protein product [Zymoseptoria tritici ST99CH_3D7]|uniref:Uncharacterized protein n=1 Tax=Zymoseptoria tritici (strain ST99CH_3D7) TaxID=1276538 RepID=A0A1X7S0U9_ZYMT9|nr:unnamed protein product [Zymoseptoria tritici ST99CH_3D7]